MNTIMIFLKRFFLCCPLGQQQVGQPGQLHRPAELPGRSGPAIFNKCQVKPELSNIFNNNILINIISYTILGFITYLVMCDLNFCKIFQIFIFSKISFAISMFISDKFKLSNIKIFKNLQIFVFINLIIALIGLILYLFYEYIMKLYENTIIAPKGKIILINIKNKLTNSLILKEKYSFLLPLILSSLNFEAVDPSSNITNLYYGIFILSLIALLCLINIIGYMIGYIFLQEGKYEIKYPKLSRYIIYYKKSSIFLIIIEVLICLTCLLLLVFFSLLFIYSFHSRST